MTSLPVVEAAGMSTSIVADTDSSDRAGSVEAVPFDSMSNTVIVSTVRWSGASEQFHCDK